MHCRVRRLLRCYQSSAHKIPADSEVAKMAREQKKEKFQKVEAGMVGVIRHDGQKRGCEDYSWQRREDANCSQAHLRADKVAILISRKNERPIFLCGFFQPKQIRNDFYTIYWLNKELSRIVYATREKPLGLGKLDFWQESIEGVFQVSMGY